MSNDAIALCDWFGDLIQYMIEEYENKHEYYEWESYWNSGAIEALETLMDRLANE